MGGFGVGLAVVGDLVLGLIVRGVVWLGKFLDSCM